MPLNPAIFGVAAAVVVLVVLYSLWARESYFKQIEEAVAQETQRLAADLVKTVNYGKSSIKLVSQSVSKKMDGPELRRSEALFLSMMDDVPFSKIEYIRKDGLKLSYDEEPVDEELYDEEPEDDEEQDEELTDEDDGEEGEQSWQEFVVDIL